MPRLVNNHAKAKAAIIRGGSRAALRAAQSHVTIAQQLAPVSDNNAPGHVHMRDRIKIAGGSFDESVSRFREVSTGRFSTPTDLNVVSEAEYSSFVEFGTVHMDAQPFFLPAYESARRQYLDEVAQLVNEELRSVVAK